MVQARNAGCLHFPLEVKHDLGGIFQILKVHFLLLASSTPVANFIRNPLVPENVRPRF